MSLNIYYCSSWNPIFCSPKASSITANDLNNLFAVFNQDKCVGIFFFILDVEHSNVTVSKAVVTFNFNTYISV